MEGRGGNEEVEGRGEEGAGVKCWAIKLSEPLTFSYKGAYLPKKWLLV